MSGNFTAWRWLILVGCLAPAYWLGKGLAHLFEAAVEYKFFENRRVLFYLIGTTASLLPRTIQHTDKNLIIKAWIW